MVSVAEGITIFIGTIIGLCHGFGGLVKLCPCGPGADMASKFEKVYGVFLGFPGTCLRIIIGLGEICAGFFILVGVWMSGLGSLEEDMNQNFKALCIIAGVSLAVVGFTAAFMHCYVDGQFPFPMVLGILSTIFVFVRMLLVEPETTTTQNIATFGSLIVLFFTAIAMCINHTQGKHEDYTKEPYQTE
mmetsp:Transcript_134597/g.262102  ORF Transcript_134597/g.262102 Transcript_134597/m.262102 type:complete len:188 (+) Transcript_134597:66-629(+)